MEGPKIYRVLENIPETHDIFTLVLANEEGTPFEFRPGQFNMVYLHGVGEIPLSVASYPDKKNRLLHTIRAIGPVTEGFKALKPGDEIGIRGPFGTSWPMTKTGCDVLVIGGGVAFPPLRTAICQILENKRLYNRLTLLYGARTPSDILYSKDISRWREQGFDVQVTVDKTDEAWKGHVGVVTTLIKGRVYQPKNTLIFICGPEIMMHYTIKELMAIDVDEQHVYLSMERNMQCGVGFCGHCQFGPYFICKDGPIFSYAQIKPWLAIKEL